VTTTARSGWFRTWLAWTALGLVNLVLFVAVSLWASLSVWRNSTFAGILLAFAGTAVPGTYLTVKNDLSGDVKRFAILLSWLVFMVGVAANTLWLFWAVAKSPLVRYSIGSVNWIALVFTALAVLTTFALSLATRV